MNFEDRSEIVLTQTYEEHYTMPDENTLTRKIVMRELLKREEKKRVTNQRRDSRRAR